MNIEINKQENEPIKRLYDVLIEQRDYYLNIIKTRKEISDETASALYLDLQDLNNMLTYYCMQPEDELINSLLIKIKCYLHEKIKLNNETTDNGAFRF